MMKKYDSYIDSAIEWIGAVPENWKLVRLRFLSEIIPSNIDKKSYENEESVHLCNYVDVYKNDTIQVGLNFMAATASQIQIEKLTLEADDVIATKDSEDPMDIGVPSYVSMTLPNVVCGYHLTLFRTKKKLLSGNFLFWLLKSENCRQHFNTQARGITRYALGSSTFKNLVVPLPPIEVQKELAAFLDRKTSEINTLINKKKQLIALLKEERTAIINHAVTKGIDPHVKYKDSGIEWIGEIPENWEIIPLKYIGSTQNGVSEGAEYFGHGYPFVSYSDVYKNAFLPLTVVGLANSTDFDRRNYSVEIGDVFFTRTSETVDEIGIASTCLQTIPSAVYGGFLIRFRPKKDILHLNFVKYFFRSNIHRVFFTKEMNIVTRASLSQTLLKKLPILIPTLEEQNSIGFFLDRKTHEIDGIILKTEKEIELMQEYKTALISEVVTGKVDVREEVMDMA